MLRNFIFSIKENNSYKTIKILGIKLNFRTNKMLNGDNIFMFSNLSKLSTEQKLWYLSSKLYEMTGHFPNLKNPKTLNEKINWMKLNYCDPNKKYAIDKYEFKNYIKEKLGDGYTIPLIGVYDDVNDIDFDTLPNQFVIKTTLDGGARGVEIVKDKSKINIDSIKYKFNNLKQEWNTTYYSLMVPEVKGIKPRIIIEEYMPIREDNALEYKMFCFYGKMMFCLIECDPFGKSPKRAFYDKNFNEVPFKIGHLKKIALQRKPTQYDEMVRIAEVLSKDFPHVRVDFYDVNGRVYVGELTFTSGGGFSTISPREWDYKMGEWLDLNKLNPEYLHIEPEFAEAAKAFIDPKIVENHIAKKEYVTAN